jgi:hypothetical protein
MAPVHQAEISPGLVVFIDPRVLGEDERVCHTQDPPVTRSGPFLCIAHADDSSTWTPLTTEGRRERLELKRAWRSGGHPQWLAAAQFLNDGANLWHGPDTAFILASRQEATEEKGRARLSEEGLTAVLKEIEAQRSRRDRDCEWVAETMEPAGIEPATS